MCVCLVCCLRNHMDRPSKRPFRRQRFESTQNNWRHRSNNMRVFFCSLFLSNRRTFGGQNHFQGIFLIGVVVVSRVPGLFSVLISTNNSNEHHIKRPQQRQRQQQQNRNNDQFVLNSCNRLVFNIIVVCRSNVYSFECVHFLLVFVAVYCVVAVRSNIDLECRLRVNHVLYVLFLITNFWIWPNYKPLDRDCTITQTLWDISWLIERFDFLILFRVFCIYFF